MARPHRLTLTHGHTKDGATSATYSSWRSMKSRCYVPTSTEDYHLYGGRGITVCDRWLNSFENFLADMGERPRGTTLDRIDPNGNYEPGNCRWATRGEQNRNKSNNHFITAFGQTKCIEDWAATLGINPASLSRRISRGMPPQLAVSLPPNRGRRTDRRGWP